MPASQVIIRSVKERSLDDVVQEILTICDWESIVPAHSRVVLKPNLGAPDHRAIRSNTSTELIAAVCRVLQSRTRNIIIGEGDSPIDTAWAAFRAMGLDQVADELGVSLVNFSEDDRVAVEHPLLSGWGLPKTALEADVFITLPRLKTHARTILTGAIKNQWGCIPSRERTLLHPHLNELLVYINGLLKPHIAIMDAIEGMEGRGPNDGNLVRMDLLLGSTDIVALDATAMRLVGLDPYQSTVTVLAAKEGLGNIEEEEIVIDGDFDRYKTDFEPPPLGDWVMKAEDLIIRWPWLAHYILFDDRFFTPARATVHLIRRMLAFRPFPKARPSAQR